MFACCSVLHQQYLVAFREVDLGPFKHKIDDGLELRKAAFECMDVLLERCKDCINMGQYITHLEQGLQVSFPFHVFAGCLASACMHVTRLLHACQHVFGMLVYTFAAYMSIYLRHACQHAYLIILPWSHWIEAVSSSKLNVKQDRLCCAVLCCAVLCCAVLCCAVLCCAVSQCVVPCCFQIPDLPPNLKVIHLESVLGCTSLTSRNLPSPAVFVRSHLVCKSAAKPCDVTYCTKCMAQLEDVHHRCI